MLKNELKIKSYVRYKGDALDAGLWPVGGPSARRLGDNGEVVYETVPSAPSCRMVHPAGHVVNPTFGPGSGRPDPNSPCFVQRVQELLQKGFIPYGSCPKKLGQAEYLAPEARSGDACKQSATGTQIDDDHPCKCVVLTRDYRRAKNEESMAMVAARYQTQQDEERRAQAKRDADIAEQARATRELAEALASQRKK